MSILIEDPQIEKLARRIAADEGLTVEAVVREGLMALAGSRGFTAIDRPPLRARLEALARTVDDIPRRSDPRSDNEILGYNEHGAW
jgi:hypothetical protein